MAYVNNEDELKQGGAGGQVLAGSGGAGAGPKQAAGTGFTNLQTYLSANKGQGGGIADAITNQGQQAVNTAKTAADTQASTWADGAITNVNQAADDAANPYNTAAGALQADPNAAITNPYGSTYGGPQTAQDYKSESGFGVNDLEQAYQNVKTTATNFQGDRMTQQAGLQKQFGYGSGFAALDGFLGRQDGGDKINSWAQGVNPGSADAQVAKVNTAIAGGKQKVADAQTGFQKANTDAKTARDAAANVGRVQPTVKDVATRGIAGNVVYDTDPTKDDIRYKDTGDYR